MTLSDSTSSKGGVEEVKGVWKVDTGVLLDGLRVGGLEGASGFR